MILAEHAHSRDLKEVKIDADLIVVGGGMAGVCCALTAAREGIDVVLVQDRPVLGGNASSEVRLWILGATSHMGNNNRWAREGGVIDEILVENMFRNKEGNPVIFDTILLEKVLENEQIRLLLNTSVYEVEKLDDHSIASVTGVCSQNSTKYVLSAPLFCDASGDGVVGFLSGASFRMGAEREEEFGEKFAPNVEDYGELLGHSMYFHTKDVGHPVRFVAPSYALKEVDKLARWRSYQLQDDGCRLWWVEYGGRLDTVHQTEEIKWELWKVIYGIWDQVKNSGKFPDAENLTLEWVGTIPGKRESRRFEGDYMLTQQDIIEQREHDDAVAFGGWSIDLHPADGVYSDKRPCNQWHSKGIYEIPYRCYYSKNISNLFLAGRIISASHVAFASTRVMATTAHGGQAVGMAASLAIKHNLQPRDLTQSQYRNALQMELNRCGQGIPRVVFRSSTNLLETASLTCDSQLSLHEIPFDGPWQDLKFDTAQLLPLKEKVAYRLELEVQASEATVLKVEWRCSEKSKNYTPEIVMDKREFSLEVGIQRIQMQFDRGPQNDQYGFLCLMANSKVQIRSSHSRITGLVTVYRKFNKAVSNFGRQEPPSDIGVESFEFWTPERRPEGKNIALKIDPPLNEFGPENAKNGRMRPGRKCNAWVSALDAHEAVMEIHWPAERQVRRLVLFFDTDYDHPMESTLLGHCEDVMPFCVKSYRVLHQGKVVHVEEANHQTINIIAFDPPLSTKHLELVFTQSGKNVPISVFEVLCF